MKLKSMLAVLLALAAASAAFGQGARIGHIWPAGGRVGQTATVHAYGDSFAVAPPSVRLLRSGSPDVDAAAVNVVSQKYLTCTFDLSGRVTGLYSFCVSNAYGGDTLPSSFTVYSAPDMPPVWVETSVGLGPSYMNAVAVGDGDRDGLAEVYGANNNDTIYCFDWGGLIWTRTIVGSAGDLMYKVAVGDGNDDGKLEVYGASADSTVYQFEWTGLSWSRTTVGSGALHMYGVAVDDGNGDAHPEVYGANGDRSVYQFRWNGASWVKTTVGTGNRFMFAVSVGDGNGDNQTEVYAANTDSSVYQFKWNGATWVRTVAMKVSAPMLGVAVGDGDSDGEVEVYGASQDGSVYRSKWNGASWDVTPIGSGTSAAFGVAVGDGEGDGEAEVYAANLDDSLYQFKWNGASWVKSSLGSGGGDMSGAATGDGNNDGKMEVYAANWDNAVYQFKPVALPDIEVSDTAYDFGLVPVGDSLTWNQLALRNVGTENLVLSGITSNNPFFAVLPPSFPDTIVPSDSTVVGVTFRPQAVGPASAVLTVLSNDPDESLLEIGVRGEGYIPGVEEIRRERGFSFSVKANPSTGHVVFAIALPREASVVLSIYDAAGRLVDSPVSGERGPGAFEVAWNPDPASGVFFYRLDSPWGSRFGKIIAVR